jgi:hypothetical protein
MAAKYRTIVTMTRHPPHALMKNNKSKDRIKVMKIIDKLIGHVFLRSAMDWSKKFRPRFIV